MCTLGASEAASETRELFKGGETGPASPATMPPIFDEATHNRCCCPGMHVRDGAVAVALSLIVVYGLHVFYSQFVPTKSADQVVVSGLVAIFAAMCLLIALCRRSRWFYWPFFIHTVSETGTG